MPHPSAPPQPGAHLYDPDDPFEMGSGPFHAVDTASGGMRFVLLAERRHCNASGAVHGGLLMTMADLTLCACATRALGDKVVTVAFNAEFLAAGRPGELLEASADLLRQTGSMAFLRGEIRAAGRLLFVASAVVKRRRRGGGDSERAV